MDDTLRTELEQLGRRAADAVAGQTAVSRVAVQPGLDSWMRPTYVFSFVVDPDMLENRLGLVRLRLLQRLGDDLRARGDDLLPDIQILDEADWSKRKHAVFS